MTTELTAFALFAFVNCITPGPNNALAAATGARFGGAAGLALACGVTVGCTLLVVLAAFGVAGMVAASPFASRSLAVVSAGYLAWLAFGLLRADGDVRREAARPPRFSDAVAFQFVNPKGWAMALAGTVLVLAPADAHAARLAAMCALQASICFASVMAWVALGVRLQRWLGDPRRRFVFNAAMAASLVACAVATLVAAFDPSTA